MYNETRMSVKWGVRKNWRFYGENNCLPAIGIVFTDKADEYTKNG